MAVRSRFWIMARIKTGDYRNMTFLGLLRHDTEQMAQTSPRRSLTAGNPGKKAKKTGLPLGQTRNGRRQKLFDLT
ncbi:hypothetical protein [uncultured Aquitalea sp.]|uniref:hypothetical protein n=1 Tax=uncultured Aquitalea sp. TaxID=540272 RepID=UPI0025F0968C|nr:hypothetical protein [uncultured Aquitalea sp.]